MPRFWSMDGNCKTAINFRIGTALIVAAAKVAACRYLLTEDLQAGQKLDGIEVVNPFLRSPESVL
jgi:predicted nucleic acid-binding protein